ncbi:hypothetical protein KAT51_08300 [bacterium]|nr:hypothetical protein [bacterium]
MTKESEFKIKDVTIGIEGTSGLPLEKLTLHWRPGEFPWPTMDFDSRYLTTKQIKSLAALSEACCNFLDNFKRALQDFCDEVSVVETKPK